MKPDNNRMSQERLHQLLSYDPKAGVFRWRVKASRKSVVGAVAGALRPDGYVRITLDGMPFMAHRLAWLYCFGSLPEFLLDHRNRVRSDNRIDNLRPANGVENAQNTVWARPNKGGFVGVYWLARVGKWVATIRLGSGKRKHLGCFDEPQKAGEAYAQARAELHTFATPETIAASTGPARAAA